MNAAMDKICNMQEKASNIELGPFPICLLK